MDNSMQSDIIQFNPSRRSSVGSNDTVVDEMHEMRTGSQDSVESSNQASHQSNIMQESPQSIGEIFHFLRNEIKDTFKAVTEENAANISSIQDKFHDKLTNLKDYMTEQISNVFREISCLKTQPENMRNKEHEIGDHGDDQIRTPVVQQPTSNRSSSYIHTPSNYTTSSYQNNNCTDRVVGMQSHPNDHVIFTPTSKINMKPQPYDGNEDIEEYLSQFQILSEVNGWDYHTRSLCLASSLKGGARAILNELDSVQRRDFDSLVFALHNRFGSLHRSEIFRAKLQTRVRKDNESLSALSQDIKKLTRCAYPGAPSSVTDVLALDQFIDALTDSDMRLRIREARPKNIEAEILAVRLETFKQADTHRCNNSLFGAGETKAVLPVGSDKNKNVENKEGDESGIREMIGDMCKELSTLTQELKQSRGTYGNKNFHNQGRQLNQNRPYYQNNQNRRNNGFNHQNSMNFNQTHSRNMNSQGSNQNQGNYPQSTSWARARQPLKGPPQSK